MEAILCTLMIMLVAGCEEAPKSERWIGTYLYPNSSIEFPLYLELTIRGGQVSGRAFDGNMEEATIAGTLSDIHYALLLHPLNQGSSSSQDIHYRGKRSENTIEGEWEHVVGMKGRWRATTTELGAAEALRLYAPPCEPAQTAQKAKRAACDKGA